MSEPTRYQPRIWLNRSRPVVTYALIALNAAIFLLEQLLYMTSYRDILFLLGAKYNVGILVGQYWRLFTPMFLHGSWSHLLFNCFAIFIWGRNVEALLGRGRYLFVYLVSGVAGIVASFAGNANWSVGASGAIFGLFGALLAFRRRDKEMFNYMFGIQVLFIIGFNLVNGFISPNIDNWGHIGGLIGGFLAGGGVGMLRDKMTAGRVICLLLLAALLITAFLLGRWRWMGTW